MECRRPRSDLKRRPGRSRLRCAALALGLTAAIVGDPAAGAVADPNQMIVATIYQPGSATGITRSVSLAALDQSCTRYAGPDADFPSQITYVFPQTSWSLRTVLECGLNQSVAAITAVAVQQTSGAWEDPLTNADLSTAGDFAAAGAVPVVSDDGSNIVYTRPQRTPTDENAPDQVFQSTALALDVYEGPLLTVAVHPGSETVAVGATVSFTAGVTDALGSPVDPATLSYAWSLDGTPNSQSQGFSQTLATAGRYTITATANDDQGGGGADTVQITVGSGQDTTTGPQDSNAPGIAQQPGTPATGPQHSAGTTPGGTSGPKTPARTVPTHKVAAARQPADAAPVKPAAPAAPTSARAAAASTPRTAAPVTRPARRVASAGPGSVIAGRLIGNVTLLPADASPLVKIVPAATATAPAVQRPVRRSIVPAVVGTLAVLVLLGLGAGSQLRWQLRPGRRLVAG